MTAREKHGNAQWTRDDTLVDDAQLALAGL